MIPWLPGIALPEGLGAAGNGHLQPGGKGSM